MSRFLSILLVVILAGLQYRIWVGEGSLAEVWRLTQSIEAQSAKNLELGERNQRLHAEVLDLKQGMEAIEERARRELGMIAKGEVFYQIVDD